jgi:serine/threonine-protein kinase PpkA
VTAQYCYIAMEYFPLGHLGTRLAQPLSPALALRNAAEIAHALAIIHTAGVVHRDLKPANVMLRDDGTMALIDFGISHSAHVNQPAAEGGGAVTGTPYYMSPEQARGGDVDERTDLYALGVMLYQMLTGEKPFVGDTPEAILDQHCSAQIPRVPRALAPYQPLLDRLLAKDRAQRLQTAREVVEVIEHLPALPAEPPAPEIAAG